MIGVLVDDLGWAQLEGSVLGQVQLFGAGLGRTLVVSWLVQVSHSCDGFVWTAHSSSPSRLDQACS